MTDEPISTTTISVHAKAQLGVLTSWQRCSICFNSLTGLLTVADRTIPVRGTEVSSSHRAIRIVTYSTSRRAQHWTLSPSSRTNRSSWQEFTTALTLASRSPPGYRLLRELGSGGSGVVYSAHICDMKLRARHSPSTGVVALKLIPRSLSTDCNAELRMARLCPRHPTLLAPLHTFYTTSHLAIVMPLATGGSLLECIHNRRCEFSFSLIRRVARDLLTALSALHSVGIAHRDVKLENVCWDEIHGAALCDLGLASLVPRGGFTRAAGTRYTQAPEVGVSRYDTAADIWSAGVVLIVLLIRAVPFSDDNRDALIKRMRHLESEPYGDPLCALMSTRRRAAAPSDLLDLLRGMLATDASKRLDANSALAHSWFSKPDTETLQKEDAIPVPRRRRRSSLTVASLAVMKVRMMRAVARMRRYSIADAPDRHEVEASEKQGQQGKFETVVNVVLAVRKLCVRASAIAETAVDISSRVQTGNRTGDGSAS